MTELPSRKASEAEIEQFNDLAAPLFEYLQGLPDQAGMAVAVLCTLNAMVVLNGETSFSKVEAWDHVASAVRKTIEENVKRGLQ